MNFGLLRLVGANVNNLNVVNITKDSITIEAIIKYDFDEYITYLDTNHLNYNVVVRDNDLGVISIIINK